MKVNLFVPCLADTFCPGTAESTRRVLEKIGLEVHCPLDQTCCGQPMFNAGYFDQARAVARHFLKVFGETEGPVITPSSSCAAMVRNRYPGLFEGDPEGLEEARAVSERTYEFCEFLTRHLRVDLGRFKARFDDSVTFHRSCHFRALGIEEEPVELMEQIPGLRHLPLKNKDRCCGFGGAFSLSYPHVSRGMVAEKLESILETGARWLVFADPGCGLNITGYARRKGVDLQSLHIARLIDRALGG